MLLTFMRGGNIYEYITFFSTWRLTNCKLQNSQVSLISLSFIISRILFNIVEFSFILLLSSYRSYALVPHRIETPLNSI